MDSVTGAVLAQNGNSGRGTSRGAITPDALRYPRSIIDSSGLTELSKAVLMTFLYRHFRCHRWFYIALCFGLICFVVARGQPTNLRIAAAGDTFYLAYLMFIAMFELNRSPAQFREQADDEDDGLILIVLITLAIISFSLASIFSLLNAGRKPGELLLLFSLLSAPLGWFVLHTGASLHYAHFYYAKLSSGAAANGDSGGLSFPGTSEPGPWDFLYYSFVVGMTAQVSDVQVTSTPMRRMTIGHGIVSFIFNTVLIAMAVNVVVALAQKPS